ncbi:MAG: hypothetical protein ABSG84_00275 [Acidobacteriaceae bacterium]|jgi:hypothetical protein
MSEPGDININFDTLKPEEFEQYLPELFASCDGKVSEDPRLQNLFANYPDCLALVRDLETIAETARSLFDPIEEPSEKVWTNIQSRLREESALDPGQDGEEQLREID